MIIFDQTSGQRFEFNRIKWNWKNLNACKTKEMVKFQSHCNRDNSLESDWTFQIQMSVTFHTIRNSESFSTLRLLCDVFPLFQYTNLCLFTVSNGSPLFCILYQVYNLNSSWWILISSVFSTGQQFQVSK